MKFFSLFFSTAVLVTALLSSGCSVSYSTGKSSDTVSTLLDSVSGSMTSMSGGSDVALRLKSYEEDVVAATSLSVSRGQSGQQLIQLITSLARHHGIVDWEQETVSFEAMGQGLRRAGIAREDIARLPYFKKIAGQVEYAFVLKGYQKA